MGLSRDDLEVVVFHRGQMLNQHCRATIRFKSDANAAHLIELHVEWKKRKYHSPEPQQFKFTWRANIRSEIRQVPEAEFLRNVGTDKADWFFTDDKSFHYFHYKLIFHPAYLALGECCENGPCEGDFFENIEWATKNVCFLNWDIWVRGWPDTLAMVNQMHATRKRFIADTKDVPCAKPSKLVVFSIDQPVYGSTDILSEIEAERAFEMIYTSDEDPRALTAELRKLISHYHLLKQYVLCNSNPSRLNQLRLCWRLDKLGSMRHSGISVQMDRRNRFLLALLLNHPIKVSIRQNDPYDTKESCLNLELVCKEFAPKHSSFYADKAANTMSYQDRLLGMGFSTAASLVSSPVTTDASTKYNGDNTGDKIASKTSLDLPRPAQEPTLTSTEDSSTLKVRHAEEELSDTTSCSEDEFLSSDEYSDIIPAFDAMHVDKDSESGTQDETCFENEAEILLLMMPGAWPEFL